MCYEPALNSTIILYGYTPQSCGVAQLHWWFRMLGCASGATASIGDIGDVLTNFQFLSLNRCLFLLPIQLLACIAYADLNALKFTGSLIKHNVAQLYNLPIGMVYETIGSLVQ